MLFCAVANAQDKDTITIPKPNFITKDIKPFAIQEHPWQLAYYTKSVALKKKLAIKAELKSVKALLAQSKNKEAIKRIVKVTKSPLSEADLETKAELYRLLGEFCLRFEIYKEAEQYLKIALFHRITAPDFIGYGFIAQQLADVNLRKSDFAEALKYNTVALNEYAKALNIDSLASCYFQLSKIDYLSGDKGESEYILVKKALPLFTRVENRVGRMECFKELGKICLEQSRFSEAKWFYIQHNILAKILGNKREIFNSVVGLARAKFAVNDFTIALGDLEEAQHRLNNLDGDNISARLVLREAYKFYYLKKGNKTEADTFNRKIIELKQVINKSKTSNNKIAVDILNTTKNKGNKIAYITALANN